MRWLYPDQSNKAELRKHRAIKTAIANWWREFTGAAPALEDCFTRQGDFDVVAFMDKHLRKVHPDMMWEYGPAVRVDGHRLVISPETRHDLEPLARALLAQAPKLAGWEFYLYRLAEHVDAATAIVRSRVGGDLTAASAKLSVGESNLVDVAFHFPDPPGDSNDARAAASIATECLLGEENYHFRVGVIEVEEAKQGRGWLPLERMKTTFDSLVASLRDQLPSKPVREAAKDTKWFLFERKELPDAEDYPGLDDAFVGTIMFQQALPALTGRRVFASERSSRTGETHAMIKLDFSDVPKKQFIRARSKYEEAVIPVLVEARLGGMWGTAGGKRYAYLLVTLEDVPRATGLICERLRAADAPKRSWVQPLDARLSAEWFGVYPDTPGPPMPKHD